MKNEYKFEDFIIDVDPAHHEFVNHLHDYMIANECTTKVELAKSGFVVSYSDIKKRALFNFIFRKSGLIIRIYGDLVNKYNDFIETLPPVMIKTIEKAPLCRRLIDITKCNSRCRMGYDFYLKEIHHQKCIYNCFMFPINDENKPYILQFAKNELNGRIT